MLTVLNRNEFGPGDHFNLDVELSNPAGSRLDADLYVVLEAGGVYYWYPLWEDVIIPVPMGIDPYTDDRYTLLSFEMPKGAGETGPMTFYAAMCKPGTFELAGHISGVSFRFVE